MNRSSSGSAKDLEWVPWAILIGFAVFVTAMILWKPKPKRFVKGETYKCDKCGQDYVADLDAEQPEGTDAICDSCNAAVSEPERTTK